jgi:branched-chain amino acid transport system ATP-binding protein
VSGDREALLRVEGLVSGYGDVTVVREVSIAVAEGDIATIVGANGAGKTSLLRTITGIIAARRGMIRFDGEDVTALPSHARVARGVVLVPEGRRLFPSLNVTENLELGALHPRAKVRRRETLEEVFEIFPRLRERAYQRAGTLSGGEQQMAAIGRGLMSLPRLLMLDEPSLGLAPLVVRTIFEIVQQVHEAGVTVLLVEQNVRHALGISNKAWVLENGAITLSGSGRDLLANEHTRKAYLGL